MIYITRRFHCRLGEFNNYYVVALSTYVSSLYFLLEGKLVELVFYKIIVLHTNLELTITFPHSR